MGPNEQELRKAMTASSDALHNASTDWQAGLETLRDVQAQLERGIEGIQGQLGVHSRDAAVASFAAMKARVAERKESLRLGRSSLQLAGEALGRARQDYEALPPLDFTKPVAAGDGAGASRPTQSREPSDSPSQGSVDARERRAGEALNRLNTDLDRAIEQMREARGDVPAKSGSGGGGGATSGAVPTGGGPASTPGPGGLSPTNGGPLWGGPNGPRPEGPAPEGPRVPDDPTVPTGTPAAPTGAGAPGGPGGTTVPTGPYAPTGPGGTGPFSEPVPIGGTAGSSVSGMSGALAAGGLVGGSVAGSVAGAVRGYLGSRASAGGAAMGRATTAGRAGASARAIGSSRSAVRPAGGVMGRSASASASASAKPSTTGAVKGAAAKAAGSSGARGSGGAIARGAGGRAARRERESSAERDHLLMDESWLDDEGAGPQTLD